MPRLAILVGGRPQIIKAFPLIKNLEKRKIGFCLIDSGQHYSNFLSENLFKEFKIKKPDYCIISRSKQGISQLENIEVNLRKILVKERPDILLVFGDMNTTLAGAITASKLNIKIAHIEAGIRSGNLKMQEERNRILTDHLSDFLAAPDKIAIQNLKKEGLSKKQKMVITGDIMLESLKSPTSDEKARESRLKNYSLVTIHRAESTSSLKVFKLLIDFVQKNSVDFDQIIFPAHPRLEMILKEIKLNKKFTILPPTGYQEIVKLIHDAQIVFTDSGGLQKETCWLGRPCVILRNETEWPELIRDKRAVLYKKYKKHFKFELKREELKHLPSDKIIRQLFPIK